MAPSKGQSTLIFENKFFIISMVKKLFQVSYKTATNKQILTQHVHTDQRHIVYLNRNRRKAQRVRMVIWEPIT